MEPNKAASQNAANDRTSYSFVSQPQPLSPMQAGMLFTYLLSEGAADRGGFDIEQLHVKLNESLDEKTLARAFTYVARRHPILSTGFVWEGVEQPQQAAVDGVSVPVETLDWRNASAEELPALRADFLARDRKRGFD